MEEMRVYAKLEGVLLSGSKGEIYVILYKNSVKFSLERTVKELSRFLGEDVEITVRKLK